MKRNTAKLNRYVKEVYCRSKGQATLLAVTLTPIVVRHFHPIPPKLCMEYRVLATHPRHRRKYGHEGGKSTKFIIKQKFGGRDHRKSGSKLTKSTGLLYCYYIYIYIAAFVVFFVTFTIQFL